MKRENNDDRNYVKKNLSDDKRITSKICEIFRLIQIINFMIFKIEL